jgi:secreted trypsin-like serine protease
MNIITRRQLAVVAVAAICVLGQHACGIDIDTILEEKKKKGRGNDNPIDSRIVGGKDAEEGRFKRMVALYSEQGQFHCGGTLILPDMVLSAAHCTHAVGVAEVGRYDLGKSLSSEGAKKFQLVDKKNHPSYGLNSKYNNDLDFALYKLSDGGTLDIKPIALNGNETKLHKGNRIVVTGWGALAERGQASRVLQEVTLEYLTEEQCKRYPGFDDALTDDMFCAHAKGGGKVSVSFAVQ